MNPSTSPLTGDPSIDGLLSWLTNGGSLTSPGAVIGLGVLVKLIVIPLLARICAGLKINLSGPNKLFAVGLVGVAAAFVTNAATHAHIAFGGVVLLGIQIAASAIGVHEGMQTLSQASTTFTPIMAVATLGTSHFPDEVARRVVSQLRETTDPQPNTKGDPYIGPMRESEK